MEIKLFKTSLITIVCVMFNFMVNAQCYESNSGKLTQGVLYGHEPELISSLEENVPGGVLFIVQKGDGYYFKICNQTEQVGYFMSHWIYADQGSDGDWRNKRSDVNKANVSIQNYGYGVFMIKKENSRWNLYKFEA